MTQHSEKAIRYIQSLDEARSNAHWNQVPELARKAEKHAPSRKAVALVARIESKISTAEPDTLKSFIEPLENAVSTSSLPEDVFQSTICLAWVYWMMQDYKKTVELLSKDISHPSDDSTKSQWLLVCHSKLAFLKGFSLEKLGDNVRAIHAYREPILLIASLASASASSSSTSSASASASAPAPAAAAAPASVSASLASRPVEFRLWTEKLLSRIVACTLKTKPPNSPTEFDSILLIFHLWTSLFVFKSNSHRPAFQLGLEAEYSRWDMWMAYYSTLSQILRVDYIYSPEYAPFKPKVLSSGESLAEDAYIDARLKQRTELKTTEARIEAKLLDETVFPKANVKNERVERWTDAVMDNWRILCGPNWYDDELGPGGKNAIAHGVVAILYRAATKTFHSTQILRHLFTVHAYLAEFELAIKSLDSYLELVTRARARSEKSGNIDSSLDKNDHILLTMSEAILILCKFGQRKDVEKSRNIAGRLKIWVEQSTFDPKIAESTAVNGHASPLDKSVLASTMACAYHALGVSEAHWAKLTYEPSARSEHQSKAQEYFRQAVNRKYKNSKNLTYLYSFALSLAETREIASAMKVARLALAEASTKADDDDDTHEIKRKLIKIWHLFTLLLSSRTDYLNAAKASTAAFEQFQDPQLLFGQQLYRSEHLIESEKGPNYTPALIDLMDTEEKIGILQVKMTQVALLEALEGSSQAVEASPDLLEMYVRLFGHSAGQVSFRNNENEQKPPKSRIGSIRLSVFKRAASRKGNRDSEYTKTPNRPQTAIAGNTAPMIQVTDLSVERGRSMNGCKPTPNKLSRSVEGRRVHRSKSNRRISRNESIASREQSDLLRPTTQSTMNAPNDFTEAEDFSAKRPSSMSSTMYRPSTAGSTATRRSSVSTIRQSKHRRRDSRISMQTIDSDGGHDLEGTIATTIALYSVPEDVDRRRQTRVLIQLWLFISGMYSRSELFDDAKDAINEAEKLVNGLEIEVCTTNSSAKTLSQTAWEGDKSIDELRADILAQRGDLHQAKEQFHEAIATYEQALEFWPNHSTATVGLCDLLLDIYDEKIPSERSSNNVIPLAVPHTQMPQMPQMTESSKKEASQLVGQIREENSIASLGQNNLGITVNPRKNMARTQTGNSSIYHDASSARTESMHDGTDAIMATQATEDQMEGGPADIKLELDGDPSPEVLDRLAARDRAYFLLSTLTKLGTGWDYPEAWSGLARAYEASQQTEKAKEVLWWCVELEDSRPLRGWEVVGRD